MQHIPMSPEQHEALRERDRRSDFEAAAIADVNGDMPGATAKQRLDAFLALKNKTAAELAALQAQRGKLQTVIDAPTTVAAKRDGLLKSLAKRLLLGEDDLDTSEQAALDRDVSAAKRRAAVAQVAIQELDEKIEIQRLRVKRLAEREHGFVKAALLEHVSETLGPRYATAVATLRDVVQEIDAARRAGGMVGLSVTIPENRRQRVDHFFTLPDFGLLKGAEAVISAADSAELAPWRKLLADWGVVAAKGPWLQ